MATSYEWIKHIELYVESSATPVQQASCVNSIATLLKNDLFTMQTLVREMEMYLTTTDNIIRSRGIHLLAEILTQVISKPLADTSIHSLVEFFSDRLADWKALSGAIVGCLALLRRKRDVGMVTGTEAKAIALSFLNNLQVQSLGQHDRKLSFELMECLLDSYAEAVSDLGDMLLYGICEAIDEEKDPQCLKIVFRIVGSLARLYPYPSIQLSNFAKELFEILGSYFPIHFTHRKGEDDDKKKEDLSDALLLAFGSTPLFEPFSIPLLLEKLSSSLPSAKLESFRYISYCTTKYGPDRMAKYVQTLWSSVKDATFISPQSTLLAESELNGGMGFQESDIMVQAFVLLQEVIRQDSVFISLILNDKDISIFMNSLNEYNGFDDIPVHVKQRLHAIGQIFSICAKSSVDLCNNVFERFFPLLMDILGISIGQPLENCSLDDDCSLPVKLNFGAIYLCNQFLGACRCLIMSFDDFTVPDFSNQTWCNMLGRFAKLLAELFFSLVRSKFTGNAHNAYVYLGVKGLQFLASFPSNLLPLYIPLYDSILLKLVAVVTSETDKTFLWKLTLKALVEIGLYAEKFPDTERTSVYKIYVVEKIVSLISSDSVVPSVLTLEAAYDIGSTRKDFMLAVVQGLNEALSTTFTAAYELGNFEAGKLVVKLLEIYSEKVIPWFHEIGGTDEIPVKFALNIWDWIEKSWSINLKLSNIVSDFLHAMITAMKKAVSFCSEKDQEIILHKSLGILLSRRCFESIGLQSGVSILKMTGLQQSPDSEGSLCRHDWLISIFASVVIALRPQTCIANGKMILQLFISTMLNGLVPSVHALGSLVNKLPQKITGTNCSGAVNLNEALDIIFSCLFETSCNGSTSGNFGCEMNFSSLRLSNLRLLSAKSNAVIGLAWIGKGLLMRGHEKLKDVTVTLLSFLVLDGNSGKSNQLQDLVAICEEEDMHQLMKCAGDAFKIMMSDSEECLNRKYHAAVRPLYKQRFFNTLMPIILSTLGKSESPTIRYMLYRAFAHVISETPVTAILSESKKLIPVLLDTLSVLKKDFLDKEILYNVLLVLSSMLTDKHGKDDAIDNAPRIISQLIELTDLPRSTAIRETAVQCLLATSDLPHTRIYPFRTQVLRATAKALDDPKRIVRQEAVRCKRAWATI